MINFDDSVNKTLQEQRSHNQKWSYIPDHPYEILIVGELRFGKTNALLNLIKQLVRSTPRMGGCAPLYPLSHYQK